MKLDWTKYEVELILHDYFLMLSLEINGKAYNKSEFRKILLPKLNNRSAGSIEFKHQNISAVLMKYKMPYLVGYKPRANYQALLEKMVLEYLAEKDEWENIFTKFSNEVPLIPFQDVKFSKLLVDPPKNEVIKEADIHYFNKIQKPNYLEIEQQNRNLGMLGEELIYEYEKWRLIKSGKENLIDRIKWVSKESGDGAGFDILSINENGSDRYIEVKTTKLGELTPFYFTSNELKFSQKNSKHYFLYRVFKINQNPNMFVKNGSFDEICVYEPTSFVGRV